MRGDLPGSGAAAIFPVAQSCLETSAPDNRGTLVPGPLWFAVMARELWQFKVAAHLHFLLGTSERTGRAWASGDREPMASILAGLLRSEDGARILEILMRDSSTKWWPQLVEDRRLASIFREAMRKASEI